MFKIWTIDDLPCPKVNFLYSGFLLRNTHKRVCIIFTHLLIIRKQFEEFVASGATKVRLERSLGLRRPQALDGDLNEAQIRQSFILPMFSDLGWNQEDPFEVFPEERAGGGFIDIRFRLENAESFVCEIKRTSISLALNTNEGREAAFQGVGYARTFSTFPYCIVTNFETTHVFHSYHLPDKAHIAQNLIASFHWYEIFEGNAKLILEFLTKSCLQSGDTRKYFDSLLEDKAVLRNRRPIQKSIVEDLDIWRLKIAKEIDSIYPSQLPVDHIDFVVETLINSLCLFDAAKIEELIAYLLGDCPSNLLFGSR